MLLQRCDMKLGEWRRGDKKLGGAAIQKGDKKQVTGCDKYKW